MMQKWLHFQRLVLSDSPINPFNLGFGGGEEDIDGSGRNHTLEFPDLESQKQALSITYLGLNPNM